MGVDMVETLMLQARRALSAAVASLTVGAADILDESPCQSHLAGSRRAFEQQCVWDAAAIGHLAQP